MSRHGRTRVAVGPADIALVVDAVVGALSARFLEVDDETVRITVFDATAELMSTAAGVDELHAGVHRRAAARLRARLGDPLAIRAVGRSVVTA